MSEAKPFVISKWEVQEAYKRVKANQGAAGVDEQSIADFERDLKGNLYKIWNRMSSGSYFPPPVRTVKILAQELESAFESNWWRKAVGDSDCIGSDCTNGGEVETGACDRPAVPSGGARVESALFLRLSAGEVGAGCSGASAAAMLEV